MVLLKLFESWRQSPVCNISPLREKGLLSAKEPVTPFVSDSLSFVCPGRQHSHLDVSALRNEVQGCTNPDRRHSARKKETQDPHTPRTPRHKARPSVQARRRNEERAHFRKQRPNDVVDDREEANGGGSPDRQGCEWCRRCQRTLHTQPVKNFRKFKFQHNQ